MTADAMKSILIAARPALTRFLQARGATAEEAEDLLQDLYIKIEARPPEDVAEPKAYLYRMADNLLLDRRRAERRRKNREESWAGQDGEYLEQGYASPDHALQARQQLEQVQGALAELPDRTFDIFRRFRVERQRQSVIAAELGISVSAVEKHLQRAYRVVLAIKAKVGEDFDPSRRQGGQGETDAN